MEKPPQPGSRKNRDPDSRNGSRAPDDSEWSARDRETWKLVRRIQRGDKSAVAKLYALWKDSVLGYLSWRLHDRQRAEELAQEVFAAAFAALPDYELRAPHMFRPWLFKIAGNVFIGYVREQERRPKSRSLEEMAVEARGAGAGTLEEEPSVAGPEATPEEVALSAVGASLVDEGAAADLQRLSGWIDDEELRQLFSILPQPQQEALTLHCVQDLSPDQVAAVMGRSRADVYQLLNRGACKIRERLTKVGERRLRRCRRPAMVRNMRPLTVLGSRRFILQGAARPPHALARATMSAYRAPGPSRW